MNTQPNIVLIISDDLAYGDLACHGNPYINTPNLDSLHTDGVRMVRHCSGPLCTPARASLLTGRYHLRTRAFDTYLGRSAIDPDEKTIAHQLQQSGYATGLFGKWHLGDNAPSRPCDMGFGETLNHNGGGLRQPGNVGRDSYFNPDLMRNGKLVKSSGYCTDIFASAAIDFIEQNQNNPFFCMLATNAPHTPLEIPENLVEPYRKQGLTETQARIYAMVENIDTNIGKVIEQLDNLNLSDNTLVIFTSDHGPQENRYNTDLRGGKGTLYEGGIRVPCLWRLPKVVSGGKDIDYVTSPIDILPTLMEATGAKLPDDRVIDGKSLWNLLANSTNSKSNNDLKILENRTVFMQWHRGREAEKFRNAGAIEKQFKWYRPQLNDDELYDIENDPQETNNLASQLPDKVTKMRDLYSTWFEDVAHTRPDNFAFLPIPLDYDANTLVYLSWQNWLPYDEDVESWSQDNPGYWKVKVDKESCFNLMVEVLDGANDTMLHIRCADVEIDAPLSKNAKCYFFEDIKLPAGNHKLEIFLTSADGKRVGIHKAQIELFSEN